MNKTCVYVNRHIKCHAKRSPPGGLEPPTFRLTAERASRLRHGGRLVTQLSTNRFNLNRITAHLFDNYYVIFTISY